MKNNLKCCSFVFWELGQNREESGTSRRPRARAVHYVELLSRDGVDCVAPRALKFAEKIDNVVRTAGSAAARAIDDEGRIGALLGLVIDQTEAKALDEAARLSGCTSHGSLNLALVHVGAPCWEKTLKANRSRSARNQLEDAQTRRGARDQP
jgi:hypothetical protein